MTTSKITSIFPIFLDTDGKALNNGTLYIGEYGLDPINNPIEVYLDSELSIALPQPIYVLNGYPYYNGTPTNIYTNDRFSIIVKNAQNQNVFTQLENNDNFTYIDNIEQLKLISNMGKVDVLGYYTKGDGGGGTFYWDSTSTESDNGGTIIQATSVTTGRWKRIKNTFTRQKNYGLIDNGNKSLFVNGAVIRKTAGDNTDWFIIDNEDHTPIAYDTISTNSSYIDVSITNNENMGNTGSIICGLDETYATHGLFVGASVSSSLARVKIAKNVRGLLNIATGGISCPAISTDNFYGTKDSTGITITHPQVIDKARVVFTPRTVGLEPDKIYIESETENTTRIIPLKTIELVATKSGGVWTYTTGSTVLNSALSGILTISETGAIITITHTGSFYGTVQHVTSAPVYKSSTEFSQLTFYQPTNSTQIKANLRYKAGVPVDSVDGDQFRIVLHDLIWLIGGLVNVDLGVVQLDPIKDLANISTGANIWIHGSNWEK